MEREHILSVLYDLTLTIGGETQLDTLLRKVLQRLLYHTAFPVGLVLTGNKTENGTTYARITTVIGDHLLEQCNGQMVELPATLAGNTIELLNDTPLPCDLKSNGKYSHCLKLPVDDTSLILLLSSHRPTSKLPLTQIFKPVLANLSSAILLCRNSERFTRSLESDRDQAKAALRESKTHLLTLVETLPELVWLKAPDGVYLACNHKFERFFGAKQAEIIGKTDYDFVDRKLADSFREKDRAAMDAGKPSVNEEEIIYKDDGHRELLETIKTPMFDADGKLIGVLGIARDITERKQAEEALRFSEERFELAMRASNDGLWDWNLQTNAVYYSPRWKSMLGYEDHELENAFSTWEQLTHVEDKIETHAPIEDCLAGKSDGFVTELRMRHKSGHWVYVLSRAIMVRDDNDQPMRMVGTHVDISEHKQAEEQIRTLSQAVEQSPVSVVITDPDANIEYVNSTFERVTGYSAEEVMGQNPRILKSSQTPEGLYSELWEALSSGKAWQGEMQNRRKNGELYWEHLNIAPVLDESGAIRHYLGIKDDITLRKQQEEHILHQAHFDNLTNLPNRFLALDRLSQLIIEADRNKERVAVLFMDLDDFKKVNDTLGHDMGDKLLIEAAVRLRGGVRSGDTVGRLGGDEFIVLLGRLTDVSDVRPVAETLLDQFRDAFRINGRELILTASIGISVYPDDGNNPSELLRNADSAMYYSKGQGRNTYSYFTEEMNQGISQRLLLEEQMHGALNRGEFRLCYQPLVAMDSGKIIGVEALLRWYSPALGEVSPMEFIPIAEHTGLIVPIGQFVLTEALGMASRWQQKLGRSLTMAVNLSPRQFRDPNLVSFIEDAIHQSGISGESLELEITEGVLMSGHAHIEDALAALSDLGIKIAMDDFGTGYSSLSYLRSYPFNVVKIDREFVNDITEDPADRELVNAAIAMAHGLGLKVVAEGVETEEQRALLAAQGCDYSQGYLFSKPVSPEEITEMLVAGSVISTHL